MVVIFDVTEGSLAAKAGILPGDYLVAVNGYDINDVLDYSYYMTEKKARVRIHRGADMFDIMIKKERYEDVGLIFKTFLMDDQKSCRNKCIFCFIDQLPEGMRESLYFKDDDSRMTFISGSYITLTNLDEADISRIIKMKTSPINISVHTTDPELRIMMLNNRFAGNVLSIMKRFRDADIKINCQIVLCRNINDGAELDKTMTDLADLFPSVVSVSVVPAGITKYRENLFPITPYTKAECLEIISQVTAFADKCLEKYGSRIFFCSDELYVKSGLCVPAPSYYENYPQFDNGVGMLASFREEFEEELKSIEKYKKVKYRQVSIATGAAAHEFLKELIEKLTKSCYNLSCTVFKVKNEFFGENITVAGLVTGRDMFAQLQLQPLGEKLLIPSVMLRYEQDMFLDGITVEELSRALDIEIIVVENNGASLIKALFS